MNKNSTIHNDDYPEITQSDLDRAVFKIGGRTVDKATWQQAVKQSATKQKISIALDSDIIAYFKAQAGGKGYQTLINQTLRQVMVNK